MNCYASFAKSAEAHQLIICTPFMALGGWMNMALVLCYSAFVLIKKGYRKRRKIFGILSRKRGNSSENNGVEKNSKKNSCALDLLVYITS